MCGKYYCYRVATVANILSLSIYEKDLSHVDTQWEVEKVVTESETPLIEGGKDDQILTSWRDGMI